MDPQPNILAGPLGASRRLALTVVVIVVVSCALLGAAGGARASARFYWVNHGSGAIAYANLDGRGGGTLDLGGIELERPEALTFDPTHDRFYVVNGGKGEVYRVGLDDGDAEPWETTGGTLYGASGGTTEGPTGTITCAIGTVAEGM